MCVCVRERGGGRVNRVGPPCQASNRSYPCELVLRHKATWGWMLNSSWVFYASFPLDKVSEPPSPNPHTVTPKPDESLRQKKRGS